MDKPRFEFELDDAIVLLLGAPTKLRGLRDRLEGMTRLEKLLFLLEKESKAVDFLAEKDRDKFEAYDFGPFNPNVYGALETLEAAGLITIREKLAGDAEDSWELSVLGGVDEEVPYATREFELTERGRRYYEALEKELPKETIEAAISLKDRFAVMPLTQLVRYVYRNHEGYTRRSKIREKMLGRR